MGIQESSRLVSRCTGWRRKALPGPGIILECNDRGAILRIRRDDLGLLDAISPGISFLHLVARESLDKAYDFLTELKKRESAFGWDLKVSLVCQATTLYIGGVMKGSLLTIFATKTRGGLLGFSRYFMDNGLLKAVDRAIREHIGLAQAQAERESALDKKLTVANNKVATLQRVLARKKEILKQVIAELQASRAENHTLQGLLPICSACKRIRDKQGNWTQLETYFRNSTGVQFTHSICPECTQTLYPSLRLEKKA